MNRRVVRDTLGVVWIILWSLALVWIVVRVIRLAWGETPAPALEPVTIHVRVERPEQAAPIVRSLLPALGDMRR